MGKFKKRLKQKGRQDVNTTINEKKCSKNAMELDDNNYEHFGDSNALVLPSLKRERNPSNVSVKPISKSLAKKQRKHLEKVVERKKKKENRSSLLSALSEVQLPSDILDKMTSITEVQTRGVKRLKPVCNITDFNDYSCLELPSVDCKKRRKLVINSAARSKQDRFGKMDDSAVISDPSMSWN